MSESEHACSEVPDGPHPYVWPSCGHERGVLKLGTGVSFCPRCGTEWRGPTVRLARLPVDESDLAELVKSLLDDAKAGS